jgi:hypothetical protein
MGHARFISYLPLLRRLCSTLCAWPVDVLARAPAVLSLGMSLSHYTAVANVPWIKFNLTDIQIHI